MSDTQPIMTHIHQIDDKGALSKTVVVLDLHQAHGTAVTFTNVPQGFIDPSDINPAGFMTHTMHPDVWNDMGQPTRVTVTVEPGDGLNV